MGSVILLRALLRSCRKSREQFCLLELVGKVEDLSLDLCQ